MSRPEPDYPVRSSIFITLLLIGLVVALLFIIRIDIGKEFTFGIALVLGACALMALLFFIAAGLTKMNLGSNNEAFGLPSGSVRALIALLLLLVFVGLIIIFFTTLSEPAPVNELKGITTEQLGLLTAQNAQIVKIQKASTSGTSQDATYDVEVRYTTSDETINFATQTITILGTLLTAVSSFYFGTQAATRKQDPKPKIEGEAPVP